MICFVILMVQRERLPASIWFALAMNVGANLSQTMRGEMPIVGAGLNFLFLWMCQLLVVCYLVRNDACRKRILVFLAVMILICTVFFGQATGAYGQRRLGLEKQAVGGTMANANDLAHTAAPLALAILFWSLRAARSARPWLWALGLAMLVVVVRTVSRGGIISTGCGLTVLAVTILLGRGARLGGILMVLFGALALSQLAFLVSDPWSLFEKRMGQKSERLAVYNRQTWEDLAETMVLGRGTQMSYVRAAGIHAHNTYINIHLTYGGITAIPYLVWVGYLGWRTARFLMRREAAPLTLRMELLCLFGMALAAQLLSNLGIVFLSSVYAVAVIEKYTRRLPRQAPDEVGAAPGLVYSY